MSPAAIFPVAKMVLSVVLVSILWTRPLHPQNMELHPNNEPRPGIVLRFGGDCLLTDHFEWALGDSVDAAFRGFTLLKDADISMVNLECPVTLRGTRTEKPFTFRMQPKYLSALKETGIDIVNIANNHIYDCDSIGLFDTISYLDSLGILHVGAGSNYENAHRPVVLQIKGKRIGFLGFYGGGEAPAASKSSAGVADRNLALVCQDIARLKNIEKADYVIVNFHWGTEKAEFPEPSQVIFAHKVIDAGADVIVGHHPHVLQGIERYKNGIIAYSLGNLIFGGNSRSSYETAVLEVWLGEGNVEYNVLPVQILNWRPAPLYDEAAKRLLEHIVSLSSTFGQSIFNR